MGKLCGCLTVAEELADHEERITDLEDTVVTVVANPDTSSSADLTKLTVGTTTYAVPTPTTVVANPSGTGTADLAKLTVGSTVYRVPTASTGNMYMTTLEFTDTSTSSSMPTIFVSAKIFSKSALTSEEITGEDVHTALYGLYEGNSLPAIGSAVLTFSDSTKAGGFLDSISMGYQTVTPVFSYQVVSFTGIGYGTNENSVSNLTLYPSIEVK